MRKSLFRDTSRTASVFDTSCKLAWDDKVVPISSAKRYARELPMATFRAFIDRGHFNQESFPELVEDIKRLKKL